MDKTWTKVLAGCGIGCLFLVLLAVGLSWMGYRWARDTATAVEAAAEVERQLIEEYGRIRDYVPPKEGRLPTDRLEVFVAVREDFSTARSDLEESIRGLARREEESGVTGGLRVARAGASMPHNIMEFSRARNQALIDAGMGVGEYTWIYWLTYFAWIGHPVDDSEFHDIMEDRSHGHGRVNVQIDGGMEAERITWRLRRDITAMLKNLEGELAVSPDQTAILEVVRAELAVLAEDPTRVPWEDGLPEVLAAGLEEYRERLEANYSRATNTFELIEFD
jgi:hypothetical protein